MLPTNHNWAMNDVLDLFAFRSRLLLTTMWSTLGAIKKTEIPLYTIIKTEILYLL